MQTSAHDETSPVMDCLPEESAQMRFLRRLAMPANESQLALALAVSMVVMAALLCGLLWQSSVITYQRDLIRWMWNWKFAG